MAPGGADETERRRESGACDGDSGNKLTRVSVVERAGSARNVRARKRYVGGSVVKSSYVSVVRLKRLRPVYRSPLPCVCWYVCVNGSLLNGAVRPDTPEDKL